MAAITDAFTDANGTFLEAHTSPGGQTWAMRSDITSNGKLGITSNQLATLSIAAGNPIYEWMTGAISSDMTFSMTFVMPTAILTGFYFSLTLRGAGTFGTGFTGYVGVVQRTAGVLGLSLNRDSTVLATGAFPSLDDGLPHILTITARGTQIALFVDGVQRLVAYDSNYSTQGQSRINVHGVIGAPPAGFYFDNASIDAAPTWPTALLAPDFLSVITRVRTYIPIRAAEFWQLTGPHRIKEEIPNTTGSVGGGSSPPIEGQLWPRGQKSG